MKPAPGEISGGVGADSAPRVLILGLDGATFDVLDPLLELGLMPNLAKLMARGVRATLRSTEPCVTAPAWTSLATGKRPDTHGVFDWSVPRPGRYRRRPLDATFRHDQAFWEILAGRGVPAGTINLPLTYPPSPQTSFCISDMLTPPRASDYTRPASLKKDLEALGYRIDQNLSDYHERGLDAFVADLIAMTRARGRAIRLCLERYPWSAAIAVFVSPDRVQHAFWHCLELEGRRSSETRRVVSLFQALDEELGRIIEQVGPSTHQYIVSDHGFGPHKLAFYVNDWLEAQGYLVLERESMVARRGRTLLQGGLGRVEDRCRRRLEVMPASIARFFCERGVTALSRLGLELGEGLIPGAPAVDWDRTVAFAGMPHGVQINLEGREPRGIVALCEYDRLREEIAAALLEVKDPRTGRPIHSAVLPREARYQGARTELAPDLVYTVADRGTTWRIGRIEALRFGRRLGTSFLATDTTWETGTHRPEGILIAAGPELKKGYAGSPCHLWDILPTLLYHLDQDIPCDIEGDVMRDLLEPGALQRRPERRGRKPALRDGPRDSSSGPGSRSRTSLEDQEAVAEHLRSLGYMS